MIVGWTPEQLEELRALIKQGLLANDVAEKLGRNRKSVLSIARQYDLGPWLGSRGGRPCMDKPSREHFSEQFYNTSTADLAARYQVSKKTIYLWAQQYGLPGKRVIGETEEQRAARVERARRAQLKSSAGRKFERQCFTLAYKPEGYQRDMSEAGQAADFMRRDRRVFRCDLNGNQSQGGKYWMCGIVWMTDAELIERARAKGFQAVRWAA